MAQLTYFLIGLAWACRLSFNCGEFFPFRFWNKPQETSANAPAERILLYLDVGRQSSRANKTLSSQVTPAVGAEV